MSSPVRTPARTKETSYVPTVHTRVIFYGFMLGSRSCCTKGCRWVAKRQPLPVSGWVMALCKSTALLCISLLVSSMLWEIAQTPACSRCLASCTGLPYPGASTKLIEITCSRSRDIPSTPHFIRNNICRHKRNSRCKNFLKWQRNKASGGLRYTQTTDEVKVQNENLRWHLI